MKNGKIKFTTAILILVLPISTLMQTGGNFTITESVVAGGGQSSNGGMFAVDGTIGQSIAGEDSIGGMFSVSSGFWLPQFAPTAAVASISGRITTSRGRGIRNVVITLTNATTGENRFVKSKAFGFYRFGDVTVGQSYILTVNAKLFQFDPNTRFINLLEDVTDADFVARKNF